MRLSLFPGCIAKNMYASIEKSTRFVFDRLGVELVDHRYTCCPAPGVFRGYDIDTWLVLGARNLSEPEKDHLNMLTICNGCYGSLFGSNHVLQQDPQKREEINAILARTGKRYDGTVEVLHFADVLASLHPQILENKAYDLGLRLAVHYGCHYLRPSHHHDSINVEDPHIVEDILRLVGCEPVEFKNRLSCCGAGGGVWSGDEEVALDILEEKLGYMSEAEPDAILNICPFCHLQFDQGQKKRQQFQIPVLHLNQVLGLAFGERPKKLAIHTHLVSTRDIEKKMKGLKKLEKAP
ncbi:MAG: CoB--CoM heterodisulfide reductase subunit B [Theionarchaea archaeon]|nr:CoB--CoM heterodisulfide reductase subunit B [Theionarchaea archaeon]